MALAQLAELLIMIVEIPESIPVMGYFIAVKCTFLERENAELMKRMLGIKGNLGSTAFVVQIIDGKSNNINRIQTRVF